MTPRDAELSHPNGRGGGGWHKAAGSHCFPLAAPIGLSPLLIQTLCGPERVLVVSTEPPDDLSCLTTPGSAVPETGCCPCRYGRGGGLDTHPPKISKTPTQPPPSRRTPTKQIPVSLGHVDVTGSPIGREGGREGGGGPETQTLGPLHTKSTLQASLSWGVWRVKR